VLRCLPLRVALVAVVLSGCRSEHTWDSERRLLNTLGISVTAQRTSKEVVANGRLIQLYSVPADYSIYSTRLPVGFGWKGAKGRLPALMPDGSVALELDYASSDLGNCSVGFNLSALANSAQRRLIVSLVCADE
jgi:hypothetical protein